MKLILRSLLLSISALMILTACHHKSGDVAPLTNFQQTISVKTAWSQSVGSGIKKQYLQLSPSVIGQAVVTANFNGHIVALDTTSGHRLWAKNVHQSITAGVATDDRAVYVGTSSGQVIAMNRQNGEILWRASLTNEVLATPNVDSRYVLVKSIDDHLYALDKGTGQTVWEYKEATPTLILRGGQSPVVLGNLVAVGFADGQLAVFDLKDGSVLWQHAVAQPNGNSVVEQMVDIHGAMALVGSTLYLASYQGAVAAIDIHSGSMLWQHDISSYTGVAVDAHHVYVTDANSHVWAFDQRTGAVSWQQEALSGRNVSAPAVLGNAVIVGDSKGYVHWLSADNGAFIARVRADDSGILATPVVAGSSVYVYTNAGQLVKYHLSD